jgi:hypothetical protein
VSVESTETGLAEILKFSFSSASSALLVLFITSPSFSLKIFQAFVSTESEEKKKVKPKARAKNLCAVVVWQEEGEKAPKESRAAARSWVLKSIKLSRLTSPAVWN